MNDRIIKLIDSKIEKYEKEKKREIKNREKGKSHIKEFKHSLQINFLNGKIIALLDLKNNFK